MKKTAIVTGGTAKDVAAMACLALNIKETNFDLADEIIIFHNGISNRDQQLINNIFPARFIIYSFPISENSCFTETVTSYFSFMVFCKYECLKLLNDYSRVIWIDYDVVIIKNMNNLLLPTKEGFRMMPDKMLTVRDMFTPEISADLISYDLDKKGINAALFVFDDKIIDHERKYNYCIKRTNELAKYLRLPEQCIFNLLLQDFNIEINVIPYEQYCVHPVFDTINDESIIIHAYGQPKFWNGIQNSLWEKYYSQWIKMGGSQLRYRIESKLPFRILRGIKEIIKNVLPYGLVRTIQKRRNNK